MGTLVFRLAMKISANMMEIHLRSNKGGFLKKFENSCKAKTVDKCLKLCYYYDIKSKNITPQKGAVNLMRGFSDEQWPEYLRKLKKGLTVTGGMITGTLDTLLALNDKDHPVHRQGRARFRDAYNQPKRTEDILSATPLEAAFSWSLACKAVAEEALEFQCLDASFSFGFKPSKNRSDKGIEWLMQGMG